jgi:hypothetical protein
MEAHREFESAFNFPYIKSLHSNSQGLAHRENRWQAEMFANFRSGPAALDRLPRYATGGEPL